MKTSITIMTPTYNRKETLSRLYDSLLKQSYKEFVWLIIDDGSTDGTKNYIDELIKMNHLKIYYHFQENSGKYVAHNTGVKLCDTELFVCVDSDDYLMPDAIEKTLSFWEMNNHDDSIAGILSPRKMNTRSGMMNAPSISRMMDLYNKNQIVGETCLVFKTSVLKQFLFPETPGEKFMTETVVYHRIDEKYRMLIQNDYLMIGEYRPDGLSNNAEVVQWRSPVNALIAFKVNAAYQSSFIKAVKAVGCYYAWKKIRKLSAITMYKRIPFIRQIIGFLLFPHYYSLFLKLKRKFES